MILKDFHLPCFQFLRFMNNKKSRVTDLFRKLDKNNDNRIPREEFIDAIMKTSKFIIVLSFVCHFHTGVLLWVMK